MTANYSDSLEFKLLVIQLTNELDNECVGKIRYLYNDRLGSEGKAMKTLEIFERLEGIGMFSARNVKPLEVLLRNVDRLDLIENYLKPYHKKYASSESQLSQADERGVPILPLGQPQLPHRSTLDPTDSAVVNVREGTPDSKSDQESSPVPLRRPSITTKIRPRVLPLPLPLKKSECPRTEYAAKHSPPPVPLQRRQNQPLSPTSYFTEAENRGQVHFLHHKVLECDSHGQDYTIKDHNITVKVSPEAVSAGQKITLEVAVAMYGPFKFRDNAQPISPILWLCIDKSDKLHKPFRVILPHFLVGLSEERARYHQVTFAKANHTDHLLENGQMKYCFQPCDSEPYFASSGNRSYGILLMDHCCFYCLQGKQSDKLAMDAGYCLTRIERFISQKRSEVHFSAVYCLATCLKALEEQYQSDGAYRITGYKDFMFKGDERNPHLKIIPFQHSQFVVAMDPSSAKIMAADINFWQKDFDAMLLRHERKMYPPRVKMTVTMTNPETVIKLPVRIEGCVGDNQLDTELIFPLGFSSSRIQIESQSHKIICERPKLKNTLKLLLPLAHQWKIIGTLLGIPDHVLKRIKADEDEVCDRLQEMLSVWLLKQVDAPPSWAVLADAVEVIDELKAHEIRTHCVDVP